MSSNCTICKNKSICKWISEKDNLETKLSKIKLKEDSPFNLICNCNFFENYEDLVVEINEDINNLNDPLYKDDEIEEKKDIDIQDENEI